MSADPTLPAAEKLLAALDYYQLAHAQYQESAAEVKRLAAEMIRALDEKTQNATLMESNCNAHLR